MQQTEWSHQKTWNAYFGKALPDGAYFTAIDHARKMSLAAGAARKARGIKAGIPDWLIVWRGTTLWIEQKAGSDLSAAQEDTRDDLVANGHHWRLCRTLEEAEQACRDVGIPLRASVLAVRERIAAQPAKPERKSPPRKPAPRYTAGRRFAARAAKAGILL